MTYSELRASDAERERVVAFLREHALLGRLTDDEFTAQKAKILGS